MRPHRWICWQCNKNLLKSVKQHKLILLCFQKGNTQEFNFETKRQRKLFPIQKIQSLLYVEN